MYDRKPLENAREAGDVISGREDETHNTSQIIRKAHVTNKSKPGQRRPRSWAYDACHLGLPWPRVSMPGPCFDKAAL